MNFLRVLFGGGAGFVNPAALYQLRSYLVLLVLCALGTTPLLKKLYERLVSAGRDGLILTADALRVVLLFGLSLAYLISGSYNPFLYFRF